jgi:hypothetical protein
VISHNASSLRTTKKRQKLSETKNQLPNIRGVQPLKGLELDFIYKLINRIPFLLEDSNISVTPNVQTQESQINLN